MLRHMLALLLLCGAPLLEAKAAAGMAVTIDVSHVASDAWRVEYRFAQPVTALTLEQVGNFRPQSWTVRTPGATLKSEAGMDRIAFGGKPFKSVSIDIQTFDGREPKSYAPFNRFTDGGTALFLGHLQGAAERGKKSFAMRSEIRLKGLGQENVIAPPLNRLEPGGPRGYAYFGPAQAAKVGAALLLADPQTPDWARATMLDAGAQLAAHYEKVYQRPLKDGLFILLSMAGFEAEGLSMNGGAVLGQLAYRFEGKQLLGDHPKKRQMLARLVAHEMAHLWQTNVARGGIGESDPWIHEGGAEAMALEGLLHTGLWTADAVEAYRKAQAATCEKLGNTVASYDGIYACGLYRFDQLGVDIVPLWRALMQASEASGAVYSQSMIDGVMAARAR